MVIRQPNWHRISIGFRSWWPESRIFAALRLETAHAAEQNRPDVRRRREASRRAQPWTDPDRLVFLNGEPANGFTKKMARLYGRCPIGERLVSLVPHGHWKTLTFIAALRTDRIDAPWVIDGPMDGTAFLTYLRDCLAPTLRSGDIAVMDNLPAHKVTGVRSILQRGSAQLCYLPPYSPDLNPIENAFTKLKTLIRSAAQRTINGLQNSVGKALDTFSETECANYFRHAGYA